MPDTGKSVIRTENLWVVRRALGRPPVYALRGVNFSVAPGEFVAIFGDVGVGKTTLLETLAGLLCPERGLVEWRLRGGRTRFWRPGLGLPRLEGRVGLLFQNPERQLFGATALEDVAWGLQADGDPQERAQAALAEAGVEPDLWGVALHRLSRGERRRVALAGVLARRPEVLLLDEPLAALDLDGQKRMWGLVEAFRLRTGGGVVVASHWPDELLPRADRVVCLVSGEVAFSGSPRAFLHAAAHREALGRLLGRGAVTR